MHCLVIDSHQLKVRILMKHRCTINECSNSLWQIKTLHILVTFFFLSPIRILPQLWWKRLQIIGWVIYWNYTSIFIYSWLLFLLGRDCNSLIMECLVNLILFFIFYRLLTFFFADNLFETKLMKETWLLKIWRIQFITCCFHFQSQTGFSYYIKAHFPC